jgi:iron complex outermembrane recepter protein
MSPQACRPKEPSLLRRLAVVLCLPAVPLFALPAKFDIPAQPAAPAIQAFIKQSSSQVMYLQHELKDVRANEVKGEYEPSVALERLLAGTGFISRANGSGKFVVTADDSTKPGSIEGQVRDDSGKPVAGARVSLHDSELSVLTDRRGRFTFDEVPAGAQVLAITADGIQKTRVTDVVVRANRRHTLGTITIPATVAGITQLEDYFVSAKKNDGVIELDPYAVSGQREKPFTANMDIPRTIDDAQPYYVFDSKKLDQSGAMNVEDFLKQRLNMNSVAETWSQRDGGAIYGNTSLVNLRGLGGDKTLILVNGRRVAGVATVTVANPGNQADINGIPMAAIDRIEVLPTSASGIYGGSAIGGVVNVVLKKNYAGGELRVHYDNTWDTDAAVRTVALSYGMSLEGGRTQLMFSGNWSDSNPLLLQDRRELMDRGIATILANNPGSLYSENGLMWFGALPNIRRLGGTAVQNLTLDNGTVLSSRITHVPVGTAAGTPVAALYAGLAANAGKWNLDLPATTQIRTGLLRPLGLAPENRSVMASVRRQMWTPLEGYAEFSRNENRSAAIANNVIQLTVPATAPSNPFNHNVVVTVPSAVDAPYNTSSVTDRLSAGLLLKLPSEWHVQADYTWSRNRFRRTGFEQVDTVARNADLANGTLNPFVDALLYPPNFSKYLAKTWATYTSELSDIAVRGSGPLPSLPWGAPTLTFGLERRIAIIPEGANSSGTTQPITTSSSFATYFYARDQMTDSVYSETFIPLLPGHRLRGLHSLDLQLAGRIERYEVDTGTPFETRLGTGATSYGSPVDAQGRPIHSKATYRSSNGTVGLKFQPVPEITFRVSRATAFLPPSPAQLIKNETLDSIFIPVVVTDPKNNNTSITVATRSGGNPDLVPQSSESWNAGVIWTPRATALKGLRFNAEYYRIEQFDYISNPGAQHVVNQENLNPERVTRDASGNITVVDVSATNLYRRATEGWDIGADHMFKTPVGTFNLHASQSIILSLKNQFSVSLPDHDAVNFPYEGGALKYNSNANLVWEWRRWTAGWSTRYYSSYKQTGIPGSPYSQQFANGGVYGEHAAAQGSDTIPSQMYHDAFVGYAFGSHSAKPDASRWARVRTPFLSGLSIQVGLKNVFDKVPPYDFAYSFYTSPYGDKRLRSYWISLRKAL